MLEIKKKYVVDEKKQPYAVLVDLAIFEKMEKLIEDYALGQLINENDSNDELTLKEGKAYYRRLIKK